IFSGMLIPHAPLAALVTSLPASRSTLVLSRRYVSWSTPQNQNFWAPVAAVPSGHGSQFGTTWSTTQKSPTEPGPSTPPSLSGAVQPWSLVTSPMHVIGLVQLELTVQV